MSWTTGQIAKITGGTLLGDPHIKLHGFNTATIAGPGDLTFADNKSFFEHAQNGQASAILVAANIPLPSSPPTKTLIQVENARLACARVLQTFFPEPQLPAGIHPTAVVHPQAKVHPSAHIGPHCVIEAEAEIDADSCLHAHNFVGAQSRLGKHVRLFPGVVVYPGCQIGSHVRIHAGTIIGSDGFGYVFDGKEHVKIPQIGNVTIGDNVEIGANVCIDRGALGSTTIGRGTRIDNLVQIAHNVQIGDHSILVAQVGIAGSSRLGRFVTVAGQAGISDHLNIGHQTTIGAQAGVIHNVPDGQSWLGTPAKPDKKTKRQWLSLDELPNLIRRVRKLEAQLDREEKNKPI